MHVTALHPFPLALRFTDDSKLVLRRAILYVNRCAPGQASYTWPFITRYIYLSS